MKMKRISPLAFSFLSMALAALGFSSCQSGKNTELKQKLEQLRQDYNRLTDEEAITVGKLSKMRSDYENIGRAECVYGGPNMMEEAIANMNRRQEEQRKAFQKEVDKVNHSLDSLRDEREKVEHEIGMIKEQMKKK